MKHYARHPMKKEVKKRHEEKTPQAAVNGTELPMLFLAIPYRGNKPGYVRELRYWIAKAEDEGYIPVSPLIWGPEDIQSDPTLLSLVKTLTHNLMIGCKTFWLCEDPDHGPQIINLSSVLRQRFPFENM